MRRLDRRPLCEALLSWQRQSRWDARDGRRDLLAPLGWPGARDLPPDPDDRDAYLSTLPLASAALAAIAIETQRRRSTRATLSGVLP
jgi:hypothetical protein